MTKARVWWFWAGTLTAALQVLHQINPGFGGGWEMINAARTLASKGYFGDPFQVLPTGPTAMIPPGYPFLVSWLVRWFGPEIGMAWAVTALCVMAHGVYVMLLPELGERLLSYRPAGNAAAALACLLPAFPLMPQWDTMLTTVGLLCYMLAPRNGLALGAGAGVLALWNPITAPMTFLRTAWMKPTVPFVGFFVIGFLLTSGPWMVRNYAVLGTWKLRTNFGTTLMVSNNDCVRPDLRTTIAAGCYNRIHPNMDLAEARLVVTMGEAAYDAKRTVDSMAWMRHNPVRALDLARARFIQYWFPPIEGVSFYPLAVWLITVLGWCGWAWMAKTRAPMWSYFAIASIVTPLPYYLVVSDIRYRAPILWISQLCAGYLLARCLERYRRVATR